MNYMWTNTESLLIHVIAGLCGTDKDKAVIIFLTLNTTRARIDLVDRLAKMPGREAGSGTRSSTAPARSPGSPASGTASTTASTPSMPKAAARRRS
jgi:hypothetical protein